MIQGRKKGGWMCFIDRQWCLVRERANLEGVRIHDYRHSFASRALALGESLPAIGKLLGHAHVETTAKYAHLARDSMHESAARVSPHTLRHSCAMHTLEATGGIPKVSLWLSHQTIQTTEMYLRADPVEKLDVLAAGLPPGIRKRSFRDAPDRLLAILQDSKAAY